MHRITADNYRPLFHFSPPYGWMNDPNGMVYHDGMFHMYYQWNPYSTDWASMHWGHAVSRDLMHWQDLPAVFEPEGPETDYWSGCIVFDRDNTCGRFGEDGGLVAIYTHRLNGLQEQHVAFSSDGGNTFTPYEGNPVIPNCGVADFRDPKVFWMENDSHWHLVLARYDTLEFYRSPDLLRWEKTGEFGSGYGLHCGFWECPDLYPLSLEETGETKWVLQCGDSPASRTQYFIGHFDGQSFHCEDAPGTIRLLDYGYEDYSGVTYSNVPDGRRLFVGWLNGTWLWNCTPTKGWRGVFSVPRALKLLRRNGHTVLAQMPVDEIRSLYTRQLSLSRSLPEGLSPLPSESSCLDLQLHFHADSHAHSAGIVLGASGGDGLKIGIDFDRKRLFVDRSNGCRDDFIQPGQVFSKRIEAPVEFDTDISLRILFDQTVAEVFAQDGSVCISALYFPKHTSKKNMFFSEGSVSVSCDIAEIESVWP